MCDKSSILVLRLPAVLNRQVNGISEGKVVVVMNTQNLIWKSESVSTLLCNPLDETYSSSFVSGGVFIAPYFYQSAPRSYEAAERTIYIPFIDDHYQLSSAIDISPSCRIGKIYEKHGKWYATAEIDEEEKLLEMNINDHIPEAKKIWPFEIYGLDMDKDTIICAFNFSRKYVGFSQEMNKLWEVEFDDSNRSPANNRPYLYGDTVVICFDLDIMSIEKHTGKEIWKYSFEVLPTSIEMVEDKIYVVADDLYILDVSTGKVLIRKNPDLKLHTTEEEKRDERNHVWMHPAEDYIIVSSPLDNFIQLLALDDLLCIHTIQIPDGYLIKNNDYAFPIITKEKLVVSLYKLNIYDIRALMMIDLSQYQPQDQVAFMSMPEIQHRIIPNLEDEHAYSIYIDTDHVFEATGYAEVMVKELVTELRQTTQDDYSVKTDWVDKKHNGVINIVLDPSEFDDHEIKTMELEIAELNESMNSNESTFKSLKLFPTDVPPLKVQLNFLQKSEWDKEGEQIDIDEFLAERAAH